MIITVTNEAPFQVLTGAFTIGPSPTGYELQVGATPQSFTTLFSVGANTPRMVTNVANGSYYRLKNNVGDVKVNWSHTCVDYTGGGSGSGSTYTAGEYISIEQDVISVTGITPDQYLTSADTQDLASQAYVDAALTAATQGLATENYVDAAITAGTQDLASQGYVNSAITAATQGLATEAYVTAATQGFMTEADVTAITSPIQEQLDDVERVTATALTELHDAVVEISGNTPDMSNYYDKDEVDAEITGATQGLATEAYVTAATSGFVTADYTGFTSTQDFEDFAGQMEVKEEVVAAALVNLDQNKISGDGDITRIQRISQSDYDDLVSGGTVDSYTFYVITGQPGN